MKFKSTIALFASSLLLLSGCSKTNDFLETDAVGALVPEIGIDPAVVSVEDSRASAIDPLLKEITVDSLGISLERKDGTQSYTYNNISEFPSGDRFPVGDYKFSVYYGNKAEEGFEKPYLYGETDVTVKENRESTVSATARLANTAVDITYTENFKRYFSEYSAAVTSSSDITHFVASYESRPIFVNPGSTTVSLTYVKPNGKKETIKANAFDAEAQHLYHITFDLNAAPGSAAIVVKYDHSISQSDITVDLSNDVDIVPLPYLLAQGFDPEATEPIEFIEYLPYNQDLDIQGIAQGGLGAVWLETQSKYLTQNGMPSRIDLLSATEHDRSILKNLGLEAIGLWNNPDKMCDLDFAPMIAGLRVPTGEDADDVKFTVTLEDRYGRSSKPMSISLKAIKLQLELSSSSDFRLGPNEDVAHVHVLYNGGINVFENLRFEYRDPAGNWIPTTVRSYNQTPASANPTNSKYRFCAYVEVPGEGTSQAQSAITIHAHCGDYVSQDVTFNRSSFMKFEDYNEYDIWAKRATVHLNTGGIDRSSLKILGSTDGGTTFEELTTTGLPENISSGDITLTNLRPGTKYRVKAHAKSVSQDADYDSDNSLEFTTEEATQLPNSGMETWTRENGLTNYWWIDYPGEDANAVWGTMNLLTTSLRGTGTNMFNHQGCSYCTFSGTRRVGQKNGNAKDYPEDNNANNVHSGDYAAVISTVGWGRNDAITGTGGFYGTATVGELYLGTYDAATQKAVYSGYSFGSRPTEFTFWYKYTVKNSADYARADIILYNGDTEVVATGTFRINASPNYQQARIPLTYKTRILKVTRIVVTFRSSDNPDCLSKNTNNFTGPGSTNLSNGRYTGSELYIDDLNLEY